MYATGFSPSLVGVSWAQARRFEYGFRGTDSLGRRYNQPAYPHFQPAADKAEDSLAAQIQRVLDKMIDDLKGKQ